MYYFVIVDGSREDLHNMDYTERKSRSDKTKVRGNVPQSFGYVKRSTSNSNGKGDSRTAQVSAVPRTKVISFKKLAFTLYNSIFLLVQLYLR